MKVVVVTGGIGSGKTSACRFLADEYGWPVYSADDKVKELYYRFPDIVRKIEAELDGCFTDGQGHFVPALLAAVIFSDPDALMKVEEIVFPKLTEDFAEWKSGQSGSDYVILESATILEKPTLRNLGDITILVDAPVDVREKRAAERDGSSLEAVRRRMKNQQLMNSISYGLTAADVDYILLNDSTEDKLYEKLRNIVENAL
jgi:dephospho-CoA kinase